MSDLLRQPFADDGVFTQALDSVMMRTNLIPGMMFYRMVAAPSP